MSHRGTERRGADRVRTRLRPGKLLNEDGGFIADCAILDRSNGGRRIRCFAPIEMPERVWLLDEREAVATAASPVWTHRTLAGLRLAGSPVAMDRHAYLQAAGPYYAVR